MKRIFAGIPASVAEAGEISAGSMWISFPSQRIRFDRWRGSIKRFFIA
jgi:hypothetical protein